MSGFTIKLLAVLFMTIDHAFKLAPGLISKIPTFSIPLPGITFSFPQIISILGRISFPLFAFSVAQGCMHTRDFPKYLKRLFIFAVISELPFDFMFRGGFTVGSQNVIWTFFFGVFAIFIYEKLKSTKILGLLAVLGIAALCYMCNTDYKSIGVILIFVIYAIKNKTLKFSMVFLLICGYYLYFRGFLNDILSGNITRIIGQSLYLGSMLVSIPIMALYNGKKGFGMKWFFYIYYPVHIIVLGYIDKLWIF